MQPVPCGHHILIKPKSLVNSDKNYAAASRIKGFILSEDTMKREAAIVSVGQVVALGPIAYADTSTGQPWCKVGDWVAYARHGGMYLKQPSEDGQEPGFLALNDIDVIAIVGEDNE